MNCYLVTGTRDCKTLHTNKTCTKTYREYLYGESVEEVKLQFKEKNPSVEIGEIKKRDYIVLRDSRPDWLEEEVNQFLEKGGRLLGGVSVGGYAETDCSGFVDYAQSLEWIPKSCK